MSTQSGAAAQMPRYKCHKEVYALKINAVTHSNTGIFLTPAEEGYGTFEVAELWVAKHNPKAGGYYVVYDDGYSSFSPAKAFEEGYTRV
jgi:hypothetical protein